MHPLLHLSLLSALVQGGYIVTLKASDRGDVTEAHLDKVRALFDGQRSTNEINHIYGTVLQGYSAEFTDVVLAQVKAMPEVEAVELDQEGRGFAVQGNAPWGLARLSSPGKLPANGQNLVYNFDPNAGNGVDVFVVDSGINAPHVEFQGHAVWGANFIGGSPNTDEHGHGSHVAGTIGSRAFGVAKNALLVAVKVLDAQNRGQTSGFIAGIDWAVKNKRAGRGCVINLSLGGPRVDAFNAAVRAAWNAGCVVVAAAGNDNVDACNISPASEPTIITVGATNIQDARAGFSNWGQCLDVFAPGENIVSTWNQGNNINNLSGTSMAAPHVSGLAAWIMTRTGNTSPAYIAQSILNLSKRNVLANVGNGSPNVLVSTIGLL